jgi:hypothetical protein
VNYQRATHIHITTDNTLESHAYKNLKPKTRIIIGDIKETADNNRCMVHVSFLCFMLAEQLGEIKEAMNYIRKEISGMKCVNVICLVVRLPFYRTEMYCFL